MIRSLITKTLNYAFDHRVGYKYTTLMGDHDRSVALPDQHIMIINGNWYRFSELPFIIAHETSHVLHEHSPKLYNSKSPTFNIKDEYEANAGAVEILVPMYMDEIGNDYCAETVDPIMDALFIPADMKDNVSKIVKDRLWFIK